MHWESLFTIGGMKFELRLESDFGDLVPKVVVHTKSLTLSVYVPSICRST